MKSTCNASSRSGINRRDMLVPRADNGEVSRYVCREGVLLLQESTKQWAIERASLAYRVCLCYANRITRLNATVAQQTG